jgi:hypothetical protein
VTVADCLRSRPSDTRTRIAGEACRLQALWIYNRFAEEKILRIGENRMKERGKPSSSPADPEELKVFISGRESQCGQCGKTLLHGSWITLVPEAGARCLACADLDELVFLPSGNAALTRRARAHSALSAVVLKWSRSRKRYERQGLLVQEAALTEAESECLADADARELRREREAVRRKGLDEQYVAQFAAQIRCLYPGCPTGRETLIAEHACLKHSDRGGPVRIRQSIARRSHSPGGACPYPPRRNRLRRTPRPWLCARSRARASACGGPSDRDPLAATSTGTVCRPPRLTDLG